MNNAYIKNPEDEWDIRWYLIEGGILESIQYGTYESFKKKLWDILVILTSQNNTEETKKEYIIDHLDNIVLMVKGCHYFLHHKKRLKYEEDWIDIQWLPNPYRCLEKYRPSEDEKLNHHVAHFDYNFTQLTREESQNFVIAFENFFSEMDLSSWLNLLDDWKRCINEKESIFESGGEYAPLKTYEQLLKLREACYVAYHWVAISYPPPNKHLIVDYLGSDYINGYQSANPFEMTGEVFYEQSYSNIRQSILYLYPICRCERGTIVLTTRDLRYVLRWLLQAGWMFLQIDYFPENWLDPDKIDFLRCPIPEADIATWMPKSLSKKGQRNIPKTLSKLFYGVDVRDEIYRVESRIMTYLEGKYSEKYKDLDKEEVATRERLLKILDVLTLIVLDLRKRRTKKDGVCYPPILDHDKQTELQKVENETKKL